MPDGLGAAKQKPTGDRSSSPRTKSPIVSPRRESSGETNQGLSRTVRQLQSEVDKLKYAEHKRRELARVVKERRKAEEELQKWLEGGGSRRSSDGSKAPDGRLGQISEDDF